ncbi:MAG: helix-turn-helix transcriptional regulator [Planctomycetales bacterium]|nr:helix-turn-helix transcriptional regulator [Planctomycetales bacterium]
MRYSFRLAELVGHDPDPRKRPGTIKEIVEHTGLDRHQVSGLLKNQVKYIPFEALSRLCDYLVKKGKVEADKLPGALFAVEPENFWELLGRRKKLELCVGVRQAESQEWSGSAWVTASDAVLLGELLNDVSTLGGSAKFRRDFELDKDRIDKDRIVRSELEQLNQTLVWSPSPESSPEVIDRSEKVYRAFSDAVGDRAMVCIGSTKSNPVVELILAETFGCAPFESQDAMNRETERSCPIFLRYRDDDPHPASCCSGLSLGRSHNTDQPGIWYETAKGKWACCPCDNQGNDAALVFYIHRESQGRLEMVLAGFSGRATRVLARTLADRAQEFWPPVYHDQGLQIGAFIVQYHFPQAENLREEILRTDLQASTEIIKLSEGVIRRRLQVK